jgi:LPXTG-motif cell wall-anchored protein
MFRGDTQMVRKMLIGAVLLVALFAAPAAAQYGGGVTPPQVRPGGSVNVFGDGCPPGAEVTIAIAPAAGGAAVVTTTTTADDDGRFEMSVAIPEGTPAGQYTVTATCGGQVVLQETITVLSTGQVAPTTPGTPSTPSDETIVRTGSELNSMAVIGAALLGLGGALLLATRSRRHRTA